MILTFIFLIITYMESYILISNIDNEPIFTIEYESKNINIQKEYISQVDNQDLILRKDTFELKLRRVEDILYIKYNKELIKINLKVTKL